MRAASGGGEWMAWIASAARLRGLSSLTQHPPYGLRHCALSSHGVIPLRFSCGTGFFTVLCSTRLPPPHVLRLIVTHGHACKLKRREPERGGCLALEARLLVQNLRDSLLYLPTAEDLPLQMRLQLRDGSTYSVHPLARDRACERERVLRPFEVSVIDIELRAQEHMVFEPCLLEACRQLHARFQVAGGYQVSVTCRFVKEEEIWRHYDEINRDFLVHRDEIER